MRGQTFTVQTRVSGERSLEVVKNLFGVWTSIQGWSTPDIAGYRITTTKVTYNTKGRADGMFYGGILSTGLSLLTGGSSFNAKMGQHSYTQHQKDAFHVFVGVTISISQSFSNATIRIDSEVNFKSNQSYALGLRASERPFEGQQHFAVDDLIQKIINADYAEILACSYCGSTIRVELPGNCPNCNRYLTRKA